MHILTQKLPPLALLIPQKVCLGVQPAKLFQEKFQYVPLELVIEKGQ